MKCEESELSEESLFIMLPSQNPLRIKCEESPAWLKQRSLNSLTSQALSLRKAHEQTFFA